MSDKPQTFSQWLDEIEVFSTREERAFEALGPDYKSWLEAAWSGGMLQAEEAALNQARQAVVDEYLCDPQETDGDEAYQVAITDAVNAIDALIDTTDNVSKGNPQ